MIDLKAKPFYLSDEKIQWVKDTIASMTIEEKIGQLFINLGPSREPAYLSNVLDNYHIGGARYNAGTAQEILAQNTYLQKNAKIPLLIANNAEGGGDGVCTDGTAIGFPVKIGATGDPAYAYQLGTVCGRETEATGCNWIFSPITDINLNWRNPIISKRCYSSKADEVLAFSRQYFRGVVDNSKVICALKHFPGDGVDERDQHLSNSVNSLSCEEWDATFGKVYRGMIEEGIQAVMVGHILMPAYSKKLCPGIADEDIMPATAAPELLGGLLREKLGFNGLILTDASHMVGLTCAMKRSELVPRAIAAGCDMFLFFNDLDEDYGFMMDGYKQGIITEERLEEALTRILATKAALDLTQPFDVDQTKLGVVGCEQHRMIEDEVAEKSITLVKNKDQLFPLTPEKYKRILIVPVKELSAPSVFKLFEGPKKKTHAEKLQELLQEKGFEVTIFESPLAKLEKLPPEQRGGAVNAYFAAKSPVGEFVSAYDLVITLGSVACYGQTVERVAWSMSKGGGEIPWYVHELPVILISLGSPFMLADVPHIRNYINCYAGTDATLRALVNKLMGVTEFVGQSHVDVFCGMWDTRR